MTFETVIAQLVDIVWSPALIGICLIAGLFFSYKTRFIQLRRVKEMVALLFQHDIRHKTGVSSFQAFTMALSGRVGTGNIVGVATAISFGGPGAIFWMWVIAFLGASSAFIESTLAQIYKTEENGELRGGPSYYIEKGLHCKWLAIVFAVCAVLGCGFLLPTIQSNSVAGAFSNALNITPVYIGIGIAILLGTIIIGGVKRIAGVAQIIAPFMALLYVMVSLVIVLWNIENLPEVFSLIFSSALGFHPVFGAIFGNMVMWGVKRGIFSNEAGQGTGPIVAAAANTSHPVKQGLVQAFSVYIDTLLVCTATAIMILSTGMYNVIGNHGELIKEGALHLIDANPSAYTQAAVKTLFPTLGDHFVALSLFFFAFTTLIAYYYYAETSLVYLFRGKKVERLTIWGLRLIIIIAVVFGSVKKATLAWQLGDIGVGLMAWINIIVLFLLYPKAIRTLRDYEHQKKQGKDPVFYPKDLGIDQADFWDKDTNQS